MEFPPAQRNSPSRQLKPDEFICIFFICNLIHVVNFKGNKNITKSDSNFSSNQSHIDKNWYRVLYMDNDFWFYKQEKEPINTNLPLDELKLPQDPNRWQIFLLLTEARRRLCRCKRRLRSVRVMNVEHVYMRLTSAREHVRRPASGAR